MEQNALCNYPCLKIILHQSKFEINSSYTISKNNTLFEIYQILKGLTTMYTTYDLGLLLTQVIEDKLKIVFHTPVPICCRSITNKESNEVITLQASYY